jgi:DNA-binding NarL/FixJ family response regulator
VAKTRVVVAAGRSALRGALDTALTDAGFHVVARCATARSAVEAVARDRPDVCIVDAELPGGALVAAAAIALPRSPPSVLVVAPDGSDAARRAAELVGASGYLRSVDEDRLADVVTALTRDR